MRATCCLPTAGILDPAARVKMLFDDPALIPQLSLLDAELLVHCGPELTAVTGIRSIVGCIETLLSRRGNPLSAALALESIRLMQLASLQTARDPCDVDARERSLYAAVMGTLATSNAGVPGAHAIGLFVGGRYGSPHGVPHAIVLPPIMRAFAGDLAPHAAVPAPEAFEELVRTAGMATRLREIGIPRGRLVKHRRANGEPRHDAERSPGRRCGRNSLLARSRLVRKRGPRCSKQWTLATVAAIAVLLAGTTRPAAADDHIRVSNDAPASAFFTALYLGIDKGIFKKHQLDVEPIDIFGPAKSQEAMTAGSIDFELGSGSELVYVAKGIKELCVADIVGPPTLVDVVVRKDSPIKSLADLKGKTISIISVGSLTEWLAKVNLAQTRLGRRRRQGPSGRLGGRAGRDAANGASRRLDHRAIVRAHHAGQRRGAHHRLGPRYRAELHHPRDLRQQSDDRRPSRRRPTLPRRLVRNANLHEVAQGRRASRSSSSACRFPKRSRRRITIR